MSAEREPKPVFLQPKETVVTPEGTELHFRLIGEHPDDIKEVAEYLGVPEPEIYKANNLDKESEQPDTTRSYGYGKKFAQGFNSIDWTKKPENQDPSKN